VKAILQQNGQLIWADTADPEPGPGEVVLQARASAVNRADLVQRSGNYPPPPGASPILGLECSGTVVALGPGVPSEALGQARCALLAGGGYAEKVAVPWSHTLPLPGGLDLLQAAALPEVLATAWLNLRLEGQLQPGERVLIHAGASGVGTAALQLCRAWGNPTFVTLGSQAKLERCKELGAEAGWVRHQGDWLEAVRAWGGADLILCPVGAAYLNANLQALQSRGRLVLIGLMGGREAALPLGLVLVKRLSLRGSVLRSRSRQEKDLILEGLRREVWPLVESTQVRPIIETVLPIERAEEAHRLLASNDTVGKIILEIS
jgi:putative PIG3 family NAD(P)H quinone oxidoreductase